MITAANLKHPVMLKPDGKYLEISAEMFEACADFIESKRTGSVQIHFRNGSLMSVEGNYKTSYPKK